MELIESVLDSLIEEYCPEKTYAEEWNLTGFSESLRKTYLMSHEFKEEQIVSLTHESLKEFVLEGVTKFFHQKETAYGDDVMRQLERYAVLTTIDHHWRDHLAEMDELRAGIGLRAYHGGMGKPIDIYKREAFGAFQLMVDTIDKEIVNLVYKLQVKLPEKSRDERRRDQQMTASHADTEGMGMRTAPPPPQAPGAVGPTGAAQPANPMAQASQAGKQDRTFQRQQPKVGRNDPCPCGSGKKYKKCHGKV